MCSGINPNDLKISKTWNIGRKIRVNVDPKIVDYLLPRKMGGSLRRFFMTFFVNFILFIYGDQNSSNIYEHLILNFKSFIIIFIHRINNPMFLSKVSVVFCTK